MDVSLLRIVVALVGLIDCLAVGGMVILAASGHVSPPALEGIAYTATGALVGILVNPGKPSGGQQAPGGNGGAVQLQGGNPQVPPFR